jgi:protein ImuA
MDMARLTRDTHRHDRPVVRLLDCFELVAARAHEVCGPARRRLALWVARGMDGPVLWVRAAWHPDRLHMAGVAGEIAPGRLVFVEARRGEDLLWCGEEALRAGAAPLVVLDLPEPPGLTPVRRLHLAAEQGLEASGRAPLCLIVTPGDGGAAGVESRWQLTPDHAGRGGMGWHLRRLRARDAPPAVWPVVRDRTGEMRVTQAAEAEPA